MKKQVLFIHGAGGYEEDKKLAADLRDGLGTAYDVRCPKMPDDSAVAVWKDQIVRELAALDGEVILVGHSLGGSILLKYLVEEEVKKPVAGVFLIAPPYWGTEDWEVDEYVLDEDFASKLPTELPVFFYHSRNDEVVPFAHLALYAEKLPQAIIREFDDRGHQFDNDLSEVGRDIRSCNGGFVETPESNLPVELSKPARRALIAADYWQLEQLTEIRASEIEQLHGVGPKTLYQLRNALDANGLSFAGEKNKEV